MAEAVSNSDREASREVLKEGHARSVWVERDPEGGARVVKRFRSKGALARLSDGRRARREYDNLKWLKEQGLPVPEVYGIEKRDGGWEVAMEFLEGAQPLSGIGLLPDWDEARRFLRELGGHLANLHELGFVHTDMHAGNALRDADWRVRLIDFHAARRSSRATAERMYEDLVHLAAGSRYSVPCERRADFLRGWFQATPASCRRPLGSLAGLSRRVEAAARVRARELVDSQLGRWLRASSRVVEQNGESRRLLVAREQLATPIVRIAEELLIDPSERVWDEERSCVLVRGTRVDTRRRWLACARLLELKLPAPEPLVASLDAPSFVLLQARPESEVADLELGELAQALGALHDRGLRPAGSIRGSLWSAERSPVFSPEARLLPYDPSPSETSLAERLAPLSEELRAQRPTAAFAEAYGGCFGPWAHDAERRAIEAELLNG